MDINQIWAVAQPYVISVVTALGGTAGITAIGYGLFKKLTKKMQDKIESKNIANDVVSQLNGADLKVSVEAVAKEELAKIKKEIETANAETAQSVATQAELLALVANICAKFKAVSTEEKEAIASVVNKLSGIEIPVVEKHEPTVIKIETVNKEDLGIL